MSCWLSVAGLLRMRDEAKDKGLRDEQTRKVEDQVEQATRIRKRATCLLPDESAILIREVVQAKRRERIEARFVTPQQRSGDSLHSAFRPRPREA